MDLSAAIDLPLWRDRPRMNRSAQALVGGRCRSCQAPCWPARAVCHRCGSPDVVEETFAATGQLITHTQVHVPRADLETPYTLGQVHVDGQGPIVFGHVQRLPADARVPLTVRVVFSARPDDTPWYWFEPAGTPD